MTDQPDDTSATSRPTGGPMPAIFVGHGSPTNAFETNEWSQSWAEFGRAAPRPRAILCVSAHWYINATAVTAMVAPRTIHDFFGFPPEMFAFEYPAPGLPELAHAVAETVAPTWVGLDHDQWGIDHGTWSVLAHMYPDADVPVVQLSIDASKPPDYHVELGAALAPLREQGVLIVASGNVVHNLRLVDWKQPGRGEAWAYEFDEAATTLMSERPDDIASLADEPTYGRAVPTPDHLLPLYYVAGLAAAADAGTSPLTPGCTLGSLSMTSHVLAS